MVATVWRQSDGGTVSGSSSTIKIIFGMIYFVDSEWRKLYNEELNELTGHPSFFG